MCSACRRGWFLPVSIMSIAGRTPSSRTERTVPPKPGWMPELHLGQSQRQLAVVHAHAIACRPAPAPCRHPARIPAAAPRWDRAGPRSGRTVAGRAGCCASACSTIAKAVNSLMSAPAMKPLRLARADDQPLRRRTLDCLEHACPAPRGPPRDSVLADLPGRRASARRCRPAPAA